MQAPASLFEPGNAMPKKAAATFVLAEALLSAFDTNDRINQYLLDSLPSEAWRADPPGKKGRDIAGVVAHMHNVRVMWLKATKEKYQNNSIASPSRPRMPKKRSKPAEPRFGKFCSRRSRAMGA